MKLSEIFDPINSDLLLVQAELGKVTSELEDMPAKIVFDHYFKIPGKLLRPSLLLLSAAAADIDECNSVKQKLIKAAAAIELIHNASLIHDDIVDHEMLRRGQKTLNNVYGNKIAVMAGNALFSRAITTILGEVSKEAALKITLMVKKMSSVEVQQLDKVSDSGSREDYIKLIEGKTALLMSNSCMLGAGIVTMDNVKISALQQFGLNFGMAYQIVDDIIDQDPLAIRHVTMEDAKEYSRKAILQLYNFNESSYRAALVQMLEYILSLTHIKAETEVKSEKNIM